MATGHPGVLNCFLPLFMVEYRDIKIKMQGNLSKYLAILSAFALVMSNVALSFADNEISGGQSSTDFEDVTVSVGSDEEIPTLDDGLEEEELQVEEPVSTAIPVQTIETKTLESEALTEEKHREFIDRLRQELNLSKTDYNQLLNRISDTNTRLEEVYEDKLTLEEQLNNLDQQIDKTTAKLLDAIGQIIEKENEITLINEQIEIREVALEYHKDLLKEYVRIIYQEENGFFSIDEKGSVDAIKLLLADGSVGENLKRLKDLDLLNQTGQQMVDDLDRLAKELEGYKISLNKGRLKLEELQASLEAEKAELDLQKESKQKLMDITLGQEQIYGQLLEQTQKEQEQLVNDIKNLSNAVGFIENRMREEGANFDPSKYKALLDYKTQALYDFQAQNLGSSPGQFAWPVAPDRGISAHFRDPSYVGVFGVQHNAVDIPQYQGSPVRAAADGVVYTARDNGYGYSYIILAHSGGLMTVYGHVSSILVQEGSLVPKGAIIALSGGMPGTLGAGYMTTGPHLHFEVHLNGSFVDPLNYLPLEILTADQAEHLPEKYQDRWAEAILLSLQQPIARFDQ